MSKQIKVLSLLDGAEVEVATCHPGQARILQKRGLADWRGGKLILKSPIAGRYDEDEDFPVEGRWIKGTFQLKEDIALPTEKTSELPCEKSSLDRQERTLQEILEEAGVEGDFEWLNLVSVDKRAPKMPDRAVSSIGALLREFAQRISLGHKTHYYEDSNALTSGFLDLNTDECIFMADFYLKQPWSEHAFDKLGLGLTSEQIREALSTKDGRTKLFGQDSDWGCDEKEELPIPSGLWEECPKIPLEAKDSVGSGVRSLSLGVSSSLDEFLKKVRKTYDERPLPAFPGWAAFKWPGCEGALPVFDANGKAHPSVGIVHEGGRPDQGFCYGVYRRVGSKLYRVWNGEREVHWDESILSDDGTYHLVLEMFHDTQVVGRPLEFQTAVECAESTMIFENPLLRV